MKSEVYELVALAMRYVFAGIMALIVARAWKITIVDSRRATSLRRLSPETGLCGEFIVISGDGRAREGMRFPVIREGLIGASRKADVRVRSRSVRRAHAFFEMTDHGLRLRAQSRGHMYNARGESRREMTLGDGGHVTIGRVELMLVLSDGRATDTQEAPASPFEPGDGFQADGDTPRTENALPQRDPADDWLDGNIPETNTAAPVPTDEWAAKDAPRRNDARGDYENDTPRDGKWRGAYDEADERREYRNDTPRDGRRRGAYDEADACGEYRNDVPRESRRRDTYDEADAHGDYANDAPRDGRRRRAYDEADERSDYTNDAPRDGRRHRAYDEAEARSDNKRSAQRDVYAREMPRHKEQRRDPADDWLDGRAPATDDTRRNAASQKPDIPGWDDEWDDRPRKKPASKRRHEDDFFDI